MKASACACGGYDHHTVSVHHPACESLLRSSATFNLVPVDRLNRWRDAGVWMQRVWLPGALLAHWRGSTAIDPLWRAMDLESLPMKYQIPDTVERLVARCLTDEKTLVPLEFLAAHPDAVETIKVPGPGTSNRARAFQWCQAVTPMLDATGVDLLHAARRWRETMKEGT